MSTNLLRLSLFSAGALLVGCQSGRIDPPSQNTRLLSNPNPNTVTTSTSTLPVLLQSSHQESTEQHIGSWTLQQLLDKTLAANPELASSKAKAESARGQLVQAGLYPNPTVGWRTEELSLNKSGGGQQGPYVNQEIVTAGKLHIAQAAAVHGVTAADWHAVTKWYEVSTKVRVAYYDLLAAERELVVIKEIEQLAKEGLEKADKLQQDGSVLSFDVKKAQVELTLSQGKRVAAEQRIEGNKKKLAAIVGVPKQAITSVSGKLEACPTAYEWTKVLETALTRSSEIQEAQSLISQAQEHVRLAEAQVTPNLQLQARPVYDFPDRNVMLFVEAGVNLPLFNRNQGNIMSAMAEVARTDAELRQTESRLAERLAESYRRFENAKRQSEILEKAVKDAEESLKLVREGNVLDRRVARYMDVLDALRLLSQVRLELVEMQGEVWKAKSEIEGILQAEAPPVPVPGEEGAPCILLP
jgi:cobalt-zinc-cadmium efflux system outer membrane protein